MKLEWKYAKDLVAGDLIAYPYSMSETTLAAVTAVKASPIAGQIILTINPGGMYVLSATAAVHVYRTTP